MRAASIWSRLTTLVWLVRSRLTTISFVNISMYSYEITEAKPFLYSQKGGQNGTILPCVYFYFRDVRIRSISKASVATNDTTLCCAILLLVLNIIPFDKAKISHMNRHEKSSVPVTGLVHEEAFTETMATTHSFTSSCYFLLLANNSLIVTLIADRRLPHFFHPCIPQTRGNNSCTSRVVMSLRAFESLNFSLCSCVCNAENVTAIKSTISSCFVIFAVCSIYYKINLLKAGTRLERSMG